MATDCFWTRHIVDASVTVFFNFDTADMGSHFGVKVAPCVRRHSAASPTSSINEGLTTDLTTSEVSRGFQMSLQAGQASLCLH